jgi:SH3 domain-containing YSC84-like protein 1
MTNTVIAALAALALATGARAEISTADTARLASAARVVQDIQTTIPSDYWNRARCVAAIPELKKAAFIFGGEYGAGVMSCRAGSGWSAPVFIQIAKGSWGFQAGAEQVDLVLLVMNEDGVQKLLSNNVTLGADASVAAGPVGGHGTVGTDAKLTAEILSYSRAKGLFAGIDLSGGVLKPDVDANARVYGAAATPRTILASRDISAPTQAAAFIAALGTTASPATPTAPAGPAASSPAQPRTASPPTTDDDVRTQLAQMQQEIDRLLAAGSATPVGTGGATPATTAADAASGSVTVPRARLVQLRQQLDAILAALNRRH